MPSDRDAILARRAFFVASALSGLVGAECPPKPTPNSEDRAAARALFEQGSAAFATGDHAAALEAFLKACELAPLPLLSLHIARAARAAGQLTLARAKLVELERCAEKPEVEREAALELARLDAETGRLTIEGSSGLSVEVDGRDVGALPLAGPLVLEPGEHRLRVRGGDCDSTEERAVSIAPGEQRALTLDADLCRPHVCLQPCLSPPPPPPPTSLPRLGAGVGFLTGVAARRTSSEPLLAPGARVELLYAIPTGEVLSLAVGVSAMPLFGGGGALVPVGPDLAAIVTPGAFRIGVGVSAGWAPSSHERSSDATERPRASAYVYPYLQPLGFRLGDHFEAGAHVGALYGGWASARDESFRLGFVTSGIWARIYFGEREERWDDVAAR